MFAPGVWKLVSGTSLTGATLKQTHRNAFTHRNERSCGSMHGFEKSALAHDISALAHEVNPDFRT